MHTYPNRVLQDLQKQLPSLRKKYLKYNDYKDQTLSDIFTENQLANMVTLKAQELASCLFINQGNSQFSKQQLPAEAQLSQVYAMLPTDFDGDGIEDLVLGGNQTRIKPELGINNASYGLTLKGLGNGTFQPLRAIESGIFVKGEVRGITTLKVGGKEQLVFVRNDDELKAFQQKRAQ